jgi:hypothetical protein
MRIWAGLVLVISVLPFHAPFTPDYSFSTAISIKQNVGKKAVSEIVNSVFISRVLDNDLVYKKIKSKYKDARITREVIANIHRPEVKDTIITLVSGNDELRFYRASDKVFPFYFSLSSDKLTFDNTLKVSAPAEVIKSKFKLKAIPANLQVRDLEGGFTFNFILNPAKTKVNKITFECSLD